MTNRRPAMAVPILLTWGMGIAREPALNRRALVAGVGPALALCPYPGADPTAQAAAGPTCPLAERLGRREAAALVKPIFNLPPAEQRFPPWLEGTWAVESAFGGFEFPSKEISRERLMQEVTIPGFQKLSVVSIPDMGKARDAFDLRFTRRGSVVVEDLAANIKAQVEAGLAEGAAPRDKVARVEYRPALDPNRMSVVFLPGRTRNAERIELFWNARDGCSPRAGMFVCSEHLRQVTFGGSSTEGVVRQVSGEYGHFRTFSQDGRDQVRLNVLTAAYLEPMQQEALFWTSVDRPVVVYAHDAVLRRRVAGDPAGAPPA